MSVFIAVGLLLIAVTSAGAQPRIVDFGNGVYQAGGAVPLGTEIRVPQSNTFVVTTSDGRVVIDTSGPGAGPAHRKALDAVGQGPVRAIILTHAHGDHTAGISAWKQPETRVIAHRAYPEFLEYTDRLAGYFARANAAQFGGALGALPAKPGALQRPPAPVLPDVLFDTTHTLTVGDTSFEILHTPGETPDHLTVWVPRLKAAFVGDNYYESFPNLYTLRGTRPRWALEYVASLDRVLALEPEVVLPSHGEAIRGRDGQRHERRQGCADAHARNQVARASRSGRIVRPSDVVNPRNLRRLRRLVRRQCVDDVRTAVAGVRRHGRPCRRR
jgi:glyoxylase-like metal-dependent hydrolase (beta-lactamase superfamily II)